MQQRVMLFRIRNLLLSGTQ